MEKPIISTKLKFQFRTATIVVASDETQIVFPSINFEKRDKPPRENLNANREGPHVVRVDVHEIDKDEARSGHYGHSGVEHVSLYLPPEHFSLLMKDVQQLRDKPTIDVLAEVDANGDVRGLTINGRLITIASSSGIVGGSSEPRTGTR